MNIFLADIWCQLLASYICGKRLFKKFAKDKNYQKLREHCHFTSKYRGAAHSICNLRFNAPNEILALFHNRSNYDYHLTVKELANKFEEQLECLRENTKSFKTFSFPLEKEIRKVDKDGNESVETIPHKIKFIDNTIVMTSSLSNVADNLAEGIHKIKCKNCDCFLEYGSVKDSLIKYKWLSCNKHYSSKLQELKSDSRIHASFLIMVSINLFSW